MVNNQGDNGCPANKKARIVAIMCMVLVAITFAGRARGFSLALDSVATWGKFPKFCVDVYRWGDRFFNSYDTAYVEGTGYKFNAKIRTDTWDDVYLFSLPDKYRMNMVSDWCTSTGLYVSYLALSVGYDINVSKYFGGSSRARKRFNFKFNCALFGADFYWINNDVGTTIKEFGPRNHMQKLNLPFDGINTTIFGVDTYYVLNNKRYSRAAAFNYSKIQKQSQGSFFFGFSYWNQNFDFDFSRLPVDIREDLPASWAESDYRYQASNHNYSLCVGYGYNWVFKRHWLLGVSESPVFGLKHGYINDPGKMSNSFSLYNRFKLSVVWNNRHWFSAFQGSVENGLIYDKDHQLVSGIFNFEVSVGYRFNLW